MIVPDLVKAVTDGQKKARDEIQGKCFMNKRLQELYIEASEQFKIVQDQGLPAPYQTRAFAEKFAELIVGECMEQVRGQYLPVMEDEAMMEDTHWRGYIQCGVDSYVAIKEHFFGVEES